MLCLFGVSLLLLMCYSKLNLVEQKYTLIFDVSKNQKSFTMNNTTTRPISDIAWDIKAHWPKPYFGAVPYIDAMRTLYDVTDNYCNDSAKSIILYFLANASTFRGEDAKRIKAELKKMVG